LLDTTLAGWGRHNDNDVDLLQILGKGDGQNFAPSSKPTIKDCFIARYYFALWWSPPGGVERGMRSFYKIAGWVQWCILHCRAVSTMTMTDWQKVCDNITKGLKYKKYRIEDMNDNITPNKLGRTNFVNGLKTGL